MHTYAAEACTGTNRRHRQDTLELSVLLCGGGARCGAADPGILRRRTHPTAAVDAEAGEARQAGQQLQQGGVANAHAALHRQHPQPGQRGQVRRAVACDLVAARDAQLRQHRELRDAGQPLHASTLPMFAVTHKPAEPAASAFKCISCKELTAGKIRTWPGYTNSTSFVMLGRMPAERSGWPTISRCSRLAEYGSTAKFLLRTLRQPVGSVRLALRWL